MRRFFRKVVNYRIYLQDSMSELNALRYGAIWSVVVLAGYATIIWCIGYNWIVEPYYYINWPILLEFLGLTFLTTHFIDQSR